MHGYTKKEWRLFTTIEQKMIVLGTQYLNYETDNKAFHDQMRLLLNWPLKEPKNQKTYLGQWSRLQSKIRKINKQRANSV